MELKVDSIDYKKAYEELKEWVVKLRPYCNNCAIDDQRVCDDCHRKEFEWECNPDSLPKPEAPE